MNARRGQGKTCAIAAFGIVVLVAFVLAPNLHGFWGRDDYSALTVMRMVGSPWPFFVQDHYPIPHQQFRPLGYFSMWIDTALFGTAYAGHAAFDIALHAAVALALFWLLVRLRLPVWLGAGGALLFAIHPAVVGPASWWSARFDVLSTLFVLLASVASVAYRENRQTFALIGALLACLTAMLSKEIGLIAVAAVTVVWAGWAVQMPADRRRAYVAMVASWATVAVFFLWRWAVIGTFSSGLTGALDIQTAAIRGLDNWLAQAPAYLTFAPHLRPIQIGLLLVGVSVLAATLLRNLKHNEMRGTARFDAISIGVCLFILPIFIQAPITAFASPLSATMSAVEAGMQSRLYYLQIAGLAILVVTAIAAMPARTNLLRSVTAFSLGLMITTLAWAAHTDVSKFAKRSYAIADVARAAHVAAEGASFASSDCRLVFLGYQPPPEWSQYVSMDAIVKALSTDVDRFAQCWILSEIPNRIFYFDATLPTEGFAGSQQLTGNLKFFYPDQAPVISRDFPHTQFFAYAKDHFETITDDVATGRRSLP